MSRREGSLPPSYFEGLYARDPDPWRFATSDYERAKYAATLDALPRERLSSALEVGCSIGILTRSLAERCDALVAVDVAEAALAGARERCADRPNVTIRRAEVPAEWPAGRFDLVLLSEVVYYLDREDIGRLADRIRESLEPGGSVLLVHWTGETDYPLSADDAVEAFILRSRDFLRPDAADRTEHYRLDRLTR